MSEEEGGNAAPGRPGQLASPFDAVPGARPAQNGSRSRKRRRTRRKGRKDSSPADMADALDEAQNPDRGQFPPSPPSVGSQTSAPADRAENGNSAGGELGAPRGGKRRRRRGRGRRGKRKSEPIRAEAEEASSLTSREQQRSRRKKPVSDGRQTKADGLAAVSVPAQGKQGLGSRQTNASGRDVPDLYAALDLGTNNCRLLVAAPHRPGRFRVVDAFSRIVRLGEGLATTGRLNDDAMKRTLEALSACANKLSARRIKGVRLIATEACRRASNGDDFLRRVESETGLALEIVDRETEARLAVAGCSSLIDRRASGVVLFDIGGGSSELALLDLRRRRGHDFGPSMISWTSLPVGVVTLSERHGGGKLVTPDVFEAMVSEVVDMLRTFEGRDALEAAASAGEIHLLGTSGTVTTLAGIHLQLPRYDRRRVDGTWMSLRQVDRMIDELVSMTFEERVKNPCIGRDRADLVLAGCAILVAIRRLWPYPRLRVADRGLREGLLTEMMNADNAWRRLPRPVQSGGKQR